jgi:hypothetical protein
MEVRSLETGNGKSIKGIQPAWLSSAAELRHTSLYLFDSEQWCQMCHGTHLHLKPCAAKSDRIEGFKQSTERSMAVAAEGCPCHGMLAAAPHAPFGAEILEHASVKCEICNGFSRSQQPHP